MWLWLAACAGSGGSDGADSDGSEPTHTYGTEDGGACVNGSQVYVDFDDCVGCSAGSALTCTLGFDGTEVTVDAGGSVDTSGCRVGTCWPATVACGELAAGDWTVVYGGDPVEVTVPTVRPECTAPVPSQ